MRKLLIFSIVGIILFSSFLIATELYPTKEVAIEKETLTKATQYGFNNKPVITLDNDIEQCKSIFDTKHNTEISECLDKKGLNQTYIDLGIAELDKRLIDKATKNYEDIERIAEAQNSQRVETNIINLKESSDSIENEVTNE